MCFGDATLSAYLPCAYPTIPASSIALKYDVQSSLFNDHPKAPYLKTHASMLVNHD